MVNVADITKLNIDQINTHIKVNNLKRLFLYHILFGFNV